MGRGKDRDIDGRKISASGKAESRLSGKGRNGIFPGIGEIRKGGV